LDQSKAKDYQNQANELKTIPLWKDVLIEMDRVACIKMFQKSKTIDDIIFSKAMLYTTGVLRRKVELLSEGLPNQSQREGR
jgi:hypothetical protein